MLLENHDLKNYYDAAESSAGEVPQFELNADGSYNYSKPLVKPETMNDIEVGFAFNNSFLSASANFYYMIFNDEIVKKGQVDRFGQPITGNVDQTIHSGIEFQTIAKLVDAFDVFGNLTLSNNEIKKGKYFFKKGKYSSDFIELNGNSISGFPDILANFGIQFKQSNLFLKLTGKYVGKMYSDNFDAKLKDYLSQFPGFVDYTDNVNDAYFVMDFYGSYDFKLFDALDNSKVFLQINNLFDNLYSAYAIGKEFFPAAERNFIAGIQIGL